MKPRDFASDRLKPSTSMPVGQPSSFLPFAVLPSKTPSQQFMPFAAPPEPPPTSTDFEAADDPLLQSVFEAGGKPGKLEQKVGPVPEPVVLRPNKPIVLPNPNPSKFTELEDPTVQPQPVPVKVKNPPKSTGKCDHTGPKHAFTCPVRCNVCVSCLKSHTTLQANKRYKKCVCGRVLGLQEVYQLFSD